MLWLISSSLCFLSKLHHLCTISFLSSISIFYLFISSFKPLPNFITPVWALWRFGLLSSYRSAFSAWFNKLILLKLSCHLGNGGWLPISRGKRRVCRIQASRTWFKLIVEVNSPEFGMGGYWDGSSKLPARKALDNKNILRPYTCIEVPSNASVDI